MVWCWDLVYQTWITLRKVLLVYRPHRKLLFEILELTLKKVLLVYRPHRKILFETLDIKFGSLWEGFACASTTQETSFWDLGHQICLTLRKVLLVYRPRRKLIFEFLDIKFDSRWESFSLCDHTGSFLCGRYTSKTFLKLRQIWCPTSKRSFLCGRYTSKTFLKLRQIWCPKCQKEVSCVVDTQAKPFSK